MQSMWAADGSALRLRILVGLAAAFLVAAACLAPRFPPLYFPFAAVCHQSAGRSFCAAGRPLAICARCLGLYTGALAAAARSVAAPPWALLFLAAASGIDVLLGGAGNAARFTLAFLLGWFTVSWLLKLASARGPAGN